jgi:hypothetical protein
MDVPKVIGAMLADLALVASSRPNERLPKEEQIRCSMYAAIRPGYRVVCAERGYASIDDGSRIECDLWASAPDLPPVWIEFKRCWSAKGWNNKPPEQLREWGADVGKLRQLPVNCDRLFVVVGLFDCDPLSEQEAARSGVAGNIRRFHGPHLVHSESKPFTWRTGDGLSWVGAWVWQWPSGIVVGPAAQMVALVDTNVGRFSRRAHPRIAG